MSRLGVLENCGKHPPTWQDQLDNQRDHRVQLVISIIFGLSAFISFCILRPRWTELYYARKKQSAAASRLPELPKSLFGWMPVIYKISPGEVLASAGYDAYTFLAFFRYAIRFLSFTLFFSVTIILPVNYKYTGVPFWDLDPKRNDTCPTQFIFLQDDGGDDDDDKNPASQRYLWMYVVFVYVFTSMAIYLLIKETQHLIRIRQAYLGTQSTVTDRTIRLSGIPVGMRSEDQVRKFIEDLSIGKVDSVIICKNWRRLDEMTDERMRCLRKLEEAWAQYLGNHQTFRGSRLHPPHVNEISDGIETAPLLSHEELSQQHIELSDKPRPAHTIRSGFLHLRKEKVDAIDYYEEKLERLDKKVIELREEEYAPTALAFVTMESTAACQMAAQAILDPTPGQLLATLAPPPADVVWRNTYRSRWSRMLRSWGIMVVIGFLTVFWAILLLPLAGLLSIEAIDTVLPGLADVLERHGIARSLIQTSLPTFVFSLLAIGVPYLYDWLANMQGMTSQGDVELSIIAKNFFFTFFNLFIVFTIWGSAATLLDFWKELQDILKDTTAVAFAVAQSLETITPFYVNLIILQGLGLLPFRLLEFGSVFVYPFYLINAKTPRDHAELKQAPIFSYGFFLPQTVLIFVVCTVYSVLPSSWLIVLFGLIYFLIGGFIYKYQLLYAMEHRQYSTGGIWPMLCNRVFLGLIIFHIAMAGYLALRKALKEAAVVLPLLVATVWFTVYFHRTYFPLMRFIALRSVDSSPSPPIMPTPTESAWDRDTDRGRLVDTHPETGLRYINPNLILPLETLWIRKPGARRTHGSV